MNFASMAVFVLSIAPIAQASEWEYRTARSQQGAFLSVDYQIDRSDHRVTYADPFYVNLSSVRFSGSEEVRSIVTQDCRGPHFHERISFALDLGWTDGHYSASFDGAKLLYGGDEIETDARLKLWDDGSGFPTYCKHEFALVVNGEWQAFDTENAIEFDLLDR